MRKFRITALETSYWSK